MDLDIMTEALQREKDDHNRTKQQMESIALSAQLGGGQLRADLDKEKRRSHVAAEMVRLITSLKPELSELAERWKT